MLVTAPEAFRAETRWLCDIDWSRLGAQPARWVDEDYGALWSRRVWLELACEIEFGFAAPSWGETQPIDPGTRRVIADGCHILYDPLGLLSRLCNAVRK